MEYQHRRVGNVGEEEGGWKQQYQQPGLVTTPASNVVQNALEIRQFSQAENGTSEMLSKIPQV